MDFPKIEDALADDSPKSFIPKESWMGQALSGLDYIEKVNRQDEEDFESGKMPRMRTEQERKRLHEAGEAVARYREMMIEHGCSTMRREDLD